MTTAILKTKAWLSNSSFATPEEIANGDISGLTYQKNDMTSIGWTFAGEAEITVHLVDTKSLIENKVAALREEAKNIRAEATAKEIRIQSKISSLLALSFDESVKS